MKHSIAVSLLVLACLLDEQRPLGAANPPALHPFETVQADAIGKKLQGAFVWMQPATSQPGIAVAFRKTFTLPAKPAAVLHLFADARYVLWVNGTYVERGPNRFQPNGPEYDSVNIAPQLRVGANVIAVLVVGNLSGGKIMHHAPGFTALLEANGAELFQTDATWKCGTGTRFRQCGASWPNFGETLVDARVEDGDWTVAEYNDGSWKPAARIGSEGWGALTARRIPLLREKSVPLTFAGNATLPAPMKAGEKLEFETGRIVQAYPVIEFDADKDTELSIEPYGVRYLAKAGAQKHFTLDTRGITKGAIVVKSGRATVTALKLIERLYPFDRVGSFASNDIFLNQLWELCARSCEVLSEDAYVDCADRERVEWMDNDPPGFDITRTAMSAPGPDGAPVFADARLLEVLVRRTALTLQPENWVKAHTCSDRYDIHAKMEDRACEWVTGIRRFYEATGNKAAVRELWPAVVAQMKYFLERRTARGLVLAREWVVWGNPVGYVTLEGAGLNAWVYKALVDAALLGRGTGDIVQAAKFEQAATELATAFNKVLWDEADGTFYSGYYDAEESAAAVQKDRPGSGKRETRLKTTNHLVEPTSYPAIFALERGIVAPEHREKTQKYLLDHRDVKGRVMIYYYLHKLLYAEDTPALDEEILDCYRQQWQGMVAAPAQCSWEDFHGGSHAHCYGMFPGYFLSSYVLGVRRDAPVAERALVIEPHLGDLTQAKGVVVTEWGPVPVSWTRNGARNHFSLTAPAGVKTILRLPLPNGRETFSLDGKSVPGTVQGSRLVVVIPPGRHEGEF